ncbi:hypothetical protein [Sorangium sp. So ce363]|uniref:hypothetical protein n=1 Tax=Sorangium sp. So ce363 TaxID=3133304 RepID=UPI003F62DFED
MQVVGHYIQTLLDLMSQPGGGEPRGSVILGTHVALSELWEEPANPEAPIDTTCLDDLVPVAWDEDPAVVEVLFGAKDMWENTASPAHELRRAAPIDWAAVARLARERTRWLGR